MAEPILLSTDLETGFEFGVGIDGGGRCPGRGVKAWFGGVKSEGFAAAHACAFAIFVYHSTTIIWPATRTLAVFAHALVHLFGVGFFTATRAEVRVGR